MITQVAQQEVSVQQCHTKSHFVLSWSTQADTAAWPTVQQETLTKTSWFECMVGNRVVLSVFMYTKNYTT